MSLDVYLEECDVCECGRKTSEGRTIYSANITHNLTKMADEAGVYYAMWRPEEININTAEQLVPLLTKGLKLLREEPSRFKKLNPKNGWGSYNGLVEFVKSYMDACEQYPKARIRTWR